MNSSQFNISLGESIHFLKAIGLYKDTGKKDIGKHSDELKKISKKNRHSEYYNCAIKNLDYEVLLNDDSLIQFYFDTKSIRYAFIQNPMVFADKTQYLECIFPKEDLIEMTEEQLTDLHSSINDFEYEQFLNEQEINTSANYIRYDASLKGYLPLLHSYSHIHIGNTNDLRIPISKTLTPLMFTKFCVKNSYYSKWKQFYIENEYFKKDIKKSKDKCQQLTSDKWDNVEENELFLS